MWFDPSSYEPIGNDFEGTGSHQEAEGRVIRLAYADHLQVDVATLAAGPPPRSQTGSDDLVSS